MTAAEITAFVNALKALKTNPVNGRGYNWYIDVHIAWFSTVSGVRHAHRGPSFLPWHREYLRLLELDLQTVSGNPNMFLPYWNWGTRSADSLLFTSTFMGPAVNGSVTSGPFIPSAGWPVYRSSFASTFLQRRINTAATRPTSTTITNVENTYPTYDNPAYDGAVSNSYRNQNERQLHDQIHVWVGGNMGSQDSPNDPLFFLHHCNVDRMWSRWQTRYGINTYRPTTATTGVVALNEQMRPFSRTPASVLSITNLGYSYA